MEITKNTPCPPAALTGGDTQACPACSVCPGCPLDLIECEVCVNVGINCIHHSGRWEDRNACPCPGMTRKRFCSALLSPFSSLFPPLSVFLFCQIIVMPLAAGPRRPSTDWRFYQVKRGAAGGRAGGPVRAFIVAGRVSARARATTRAVQSNWKRSPNFLACELSPHSVGRCVYYASRFFGTPLVLTPALCPLCSAHNCLYAFSNWISIFSHAEVTFFVSKYSICFAKRIHFGLALIPWQHTRLPALCTHT